MRIIAGEARGRRIFPPVDRSIRPLLDRIRESLFSKLGDAFEGKQVLDLFCGVGSFGLEALSRGARRAVFVDRSPGSLALLQKNLDLLSFGPRAEVIRGDALVVPRAAGAIEQGRFAVVFLDPPFNMFHSIASAEPVFRRAGELLHEGFLESEGQLLLRIPSSYRGECPIPGATSFTYGESVVLGFRPPGPGGS